MAIFQVTIQKNIGTEYWTNDYYVNTADLDAAEAAAREIVAAEYRIHMETVQFGTVRIRTTIEGDEVYRNIFVPSNGQRPYNEYLPLFNVFTAVLSPAEGRPSIKYLRGPVGKPDTVNGGVVTAVSTGPFDLYRNQLEAIESLCDVDGQPILSVQLKPQVGMRQLRRGSKRRSQPVLPAGDAG